MQAKDLKVNQLIEISVDQDETEYKNLASRIEEISEQHINISFPMVRGEILPLRVGQRLTINFVKDNRSYRFDSRIVDRTMNPIPMLSLVKPEKIIEIQRRKWVRVAVTLPICFGIEGVEALEAFQANTLDISGGGALLLTQAQVQMQAGQILNMEIQLPKRSPVFCKARVLRVISEEGRRDKSFRVVLEFCEISEGQRDKIVSFIFEKQREWIRKGLL